MRFVVVSHGQASDPFWSVVKNGVDQAAADLGVTVEYQAPGTFDMVQMAQIIDAAVASQPDGLVVSVPDAEALGDSIRNAVASGIPVVSMNSGSDVREELGVAVHVGQTEYEAGLGGGKQMKEAGVTKAICVNQEVGNVALDLRCEGFTDGLEGAVEVVAVSMDPTEIGNAVKAYLSANPDTDGVLTLGPSAAEPTMAALEEIEMLDKVKFGTFDLSPGVLEAIDAGPDDVRDRPAAVSAGLPADPAAQAARAVRPDAGRHGDDRAGLRHPGERGAGDRAVREGHPLAAAAAGPVAPAGPPILAQARGGAMATRQDCNRRRTGRRDALSKQADGPARARGRGGTILVFIFFGIVAGGSGLFSAPGIINFLEVSAQLGIIAVAASMLMIGGEFDLSIGSMIGAAGVIIAIPAVQWGLPLWLCILLAFAVACAIGYVNGLIVIRSGLPSFIVTLAGLFILRGLTIGFTRWITGRTQVSGLKALAEQDWLAPLFAGEVGHTLMVWLAGIGLIGTRADGAPAVVRHPDVDRLVGRADRGRDLDPAAHPGRQLDLRLRRRSQRGAQRRRAGRRGQDRPVHVHRLRRDAVRRRSRCWMPARPTPRAACSRSSRRSSPR